jgi:hypothetical protein
MALCRGVPVVDTKKVGFRSISGKWVGAVAKMVGI